jgi:hypothetical protein
MTKAGWGTLGCIVISGLAGAARADESALPAVGSRVRVRSLESGSLVGRLSAVDDTYLTVVRSDRDAASVIARRDVTRLEQSVRPSRRGKGALLGFAIGFGVGFAAAAALGNCSETGAVDHCADPVASSLYGAMAGAAGAAIGALVAPGERWVEIPLNRGPSPTPKAPGRALLRVVPLAGARRGALVAVSW